ncbi:RNA-directed DNA polymerase [Myxococcus sp. SDU36]|uniref:RNA-directed DNA polymerase n=1 Tax=Myxococcus sp. SDU36 TaxID=2831967 RepID=UPI0025434CAB|nr:RNA-directed DNA polymerase [Myxococcus sp. SDU36]WIG98559.1 RNA-directed DNA polymerase [Myxococcus sp. SDU36]
MVDPYFIWWKKRQVSIADSAKSTPNGLVAYFDIRQFYDSVPHTLTSSAWANHCETGQLAHKWRTLGDKLIADYQQIKPGNTGLVAGPMFAHVLGNLILREVDNFLSATFPGSYFRYVDDIALVLNTRSIERATEVIRHALPLGLRLHEDKTLGLDTADWIRITQSFPNETGTYFWAKLIGGIKYFLAARSNQAPVLRRILADNGFRIPIRDYSTSVGEIPYLQRLSARFRERWLSNHTFPQTPNDLLELAKIARHELQIRFERFTEEPPQQGMLRKFQLQKIRYTATRLLYLGDPVRLPKIEAAIESTIEMSDISAIYKSLRTGDVSELLSYSSSVAQSAAQLLATDPKPLRCNVTSWRPELEAAWAVLNMNGIQFTADASSPPETPLVNFSTQSRNASTSDPYFEEVFALARGTTIKHETLLRTAFDYEEEHVLDAIRSLRSSS